MSGLLNSIGSRSGVLSTTEYKVNQLPNFDRPGDGHYIVDTQTVLLMQSNYLENDSQDNWDSSRANHGVSRTGNVHHKRNDSVISGSSYYFDGGLNFLEFPDNDDWNFGMQDFTFDFWIKFDGIGVSDHGFASIWYQGTGSSNMVELGLNSDGSMIFLAHTGSYIINTATSAGAFVTDTWYHVAYVRRANTFKLYRNGTSITCNISHGSAAGVMPNISAVARIGECTYDSGDRNFKGWIDEFRVSKGVARWSEDFTVYPHGGVYS